MFDKPIQESWLEVGHRRCQVQLKWRDGEFGESLRGGQVTATLRSETLNCFLSRLLCISFTGVFLFSFSKVKNVLHLKLSLSPALPLHPAKGMKCAMLSAKKKILEKKVKKRQDKQQGDGSYRGANLAVCLGDKMS